MSTDKDLALALQLQAQYENSVSRQSSTPVKKNDPNRKVDLGSPSLEIRDPTPNAHELFVSFNRTYFWGKLESVAVRWSKKMYSCAGICRYETRNGFCDIALSEPLLKLRPRKDLVETLLHEMIHAFLFVTNNDRERQEHGPNFLFHMHRINKETNLNISVYHTFHDEVDLYKTHWWRCNGSCQNRRPYFGYIKRTSNRAPGPNDFWWSTHQSTCGGSFLKIKEPQKKEKAASEKGNKTNPKKTQSNVRTIDDLFNKENNNNTITGSKNTPSTFLVPTAVNIPSTSISNNRKSTGSVLSFVKPVHSTMASNAILSPQGNELGKSVRGKSIAETVRESWLQKYDSNKRPCDTSTDESRSSKIIKLDSEKINENSIHVDDSLNSTKNSSIFDGNTNLPSISKDTSSSAFKNIAHLLSTAVDFGRSLFTSKDIAHSSSTSKDIAHSSSTSKDISHIPSTSKTDNINNDENEIFSLYYSIPPKLLDDCNKIMRPLYGEDFTLDEHHFKSKSTSSDLWQKALEIEENCKVPCPICNRKFARTEIEDHVNVCLENRPNSSIEIDLTEAEYVPVNVAKDFDDDDFDLTTVEDGVQHSKVADGSVTDLTKVDDVEHTIPTDVAKDFDDDDFDLTSVEESKHRSNVEECVVDLTENNELRENTAIKMEPESSQSQDNDDVANSDYCFCPLCHKRLNRNNVDKHLEQCVAKSFVNESTSKSVKSDNPDEDVDTDEDSADGKKVACPCCNRLFEANEINSHLDECLL